MDAEERMKGNFLSCLKNRLLVSLAFVSLVLLFSHCHFAACLPISGHRGERERGKAEENP
jgi:hypothetical protein